MTARALAVYREISAVGRIEGAAPGQLVLALFDELIDCLDCLHGAIRSGTPVRRDTARNRADVILVSMESGTNVEAGVLSRRMMSTYRAVRELLRHAVAENDPVFCAEARMLLLPIVEAWRTII